MFDTVELTELTAKVAGTDERLIADDDLLDGVRAIEAARRFLDGAEGAMLAELDARGTTDIVGGLRTAQWLAHTAGVSPATAKSRVRVGNTLRRDLPETQTAARDGRLSFDRARVMAGAFNERIAEEFRVLEAELIDMSSRMTFDRWCRHVNAVANLLDQDGSYDPASDVTNNHLTLMPGPDGTRITGTLVGSTALTVEQAIAQVTNELYEQYKADRDATEGAVEIPPQRTLRALAVAEICRRALESTATGSLPNVEATLVINTDTPEAVFDPSGLQRNGVDDLLCDMGLYAIILNSLGVPIDMGREIRTANRAQRRGLASRDGGCVFPGCGAQPHRCHAHHVAHWARDVGTTDIANLVFLCRHHHALIHRRGWTIHIGDDGWAWITSPTGKTMWCQRHGEQRAGPPPP